MGLSQLRWPTWRRLKSIFIVIHIIAPFMYLAAAQVQPYTGVGAQQQRQECAC
jgi:hypothetical protein